MRPALHRALALGLGFLAAALATGHAPAQAPATVTASRSAEISAFAELTAVSAGYCSPCHATGVVLGADYTHFSRRLLNPALEVRGSVTTGSPVSENSLALGLHLGPELGRLHPFADLLAGLGSIHYNPPIVYPDGTVYSHDNSAVFQVGGGLQYDVRPNWAIQAEVQAQRWNLGSTTPVIFHPVAVDLGIVYRIPFHPYGSR